MRHPACIPRASISPAGDATLKSRDPATNSLLSFAIGEPGDGQEGVFIDRAPVS